MKTFFKLIGILFGLGALAALALVLLMPWMDRWGATEAEIAAIYPGDELVPAPPVFYNRAVTINATPEEIYPWILQLGAERGGMYSYTWLEGAMRCPLINADRIHPEWQDLQVGDPVKMCPGDFGPPPFEVALLVPARSVVLGHQENGVWSDVWEFNLVPQPDGTTRLVLRSRDTLTGGFWDVIRPGVFVMTRGMLLGINERAEKFAQVQAY